MRAFFLLSFLFMLVGFTFAQPIWQSNLDSEIKFYQTTDFGILLVGTNNSLYGIDGKTGQRLWRRGHKGLNETSITPVPSTDLVLFTLGTGKKSRLEAVDLLTGNSLWRSDKVKGDVLQLAVEPSQDLIAIVMVKKTLGTFGKRLKRKPITHVFRLSTGKELWKRKFVNSVELMPSRFDVEGKIAFTLDNYRPPLILDGRLFMFYEGVTSYNATTGKSREREKFGINEDGLALTDADPVFDEKHIYLSGRGRVRAVDRRTGNVVWKAKDLGVTPEMAVVGNILYVRTGGQFTRIRDGKIKQKEPFGVSAIDARTGKKLWRFKGADKGLTNFVFADEKTILIADKDDLISIDARNGKRLRKSNHKVKNAQFVLINEKREAVVGGNGELRAFQVSDLRLKRKGKINPVWTAKHKPPTRGIFRIITGIALRATALYFRYGGLATSALNLVRGANIARSALSLRWSGLKTRFSGFDLTTLASNAGRDYVSNSVKVFGIASRNPDVLNRLRGLQVIVPNSSNVRGRVIGGAANRIPSRANMQESFLDKLDPVRRIEKLSDYFLRRKRLSAFRENYMYFYTDLPKPFDKKGLIGVNIHTGEDARFILISNPDSRFTTDEINGLLYSAKGRKLLAFDVLAR